MEKSIESVFFKPILAVDQGSKIRMLGTGSTLGCDAFDCGFFIEIKGEILATRAC